MSSPNERTESKWKPSVAERSPGMYLWTKEELARQIAQAGRQTRQEEAAWKAHRAQEKEELFEVVRERVQAARGLDARLDALEEAADERERHVAKREKEARRSAIMVRSEGGVWLFEERKIYHA